MKGLILKDFINLKKNFKVLGAFLLFYIFMAFYMDNPSYIISMFTVVFAMLTLTSYSFDDFAKWDAYALTMPISKEDIIRSKYLLLLILSGISFLCSNFAVLILNIMMNRQDTLEGVLITALSSAVVIFSNSIIIPFVIKLGVEKARIIILAVYGIPIFIGSVVYKQLISHYTELPETLISVFGIIIDYAYIIIPITLLAVLLISYFISIKIYAKKEF